MRKSDAALWLRDKTREGGRVTTRIVVHDNTSENEKNKNKNPRVVGGILNASMRPGNGPPKIKEGKMEMEMEKGQGDARRALIYIYI